MPLGLVPRSVSLKLPAAVLALVIGAPFIEYVESMTMTASTVWLLKPEIALALTSELLMPKIGRKYIRTLLLALIVNVLLAPLGLIPVHDAVGSFACR